VIESIEGRLLTSTLAGTTAARAGHAEVHAAAAAATGRNAILIVNPTNLNVAYVIKRGPGRHSTIKFDSSIDPGFQEKDYILNKGAVYTFTLNLDGRGIDLRRV
jgi:hypothetical protein